MSLTELDLPALRRWLMTARADVAAYEEDLNRLNVFPVPDSDTGTNMLVTFDGALGLVTGTVPANLAESAQQLSHAMLVSARGNSGVILSQLARGVYEVMGKGHTIGAVEVTEMMRRASTYARAGVSSPQEGTVLTVARAAADAGELALQRGADLEGVIDAAVEAAAEALAHTTEQLQVLENAGVVDAGGAGYLLVLEALQRVVQGQPGLARSRREDPPWLSRSINPPLIASPAAAVRDGDSGSDQHSGPDYEVMYLIDKTGPGRIDMLRDALDALGDSVVVAGGPKVWSVHVHTDRIADVLDAGVVAGRPHQFQVTRFADRPEMVCATRVAVMATVDGPGLTALVREAGARPLPLRTDAGARRQLLRAVRESGAGEVLILGAVPVMQETVDQIVRTVAAEGIRVVAPVSPTSAHVLAALAVIDPEEPIDQVVSVVEATLADVHAATVEFGERSAGRFGADELIASVGGDEVARGLDLTIVGTAAAQGLVAAGDIELITLVRGAGVPVELVEHVAHNLPGIEIDIIDGGAADVALTIGAE